VEGWVDLGTAGRVCSPCPRLYNVHRSVCRDKHNWPWPLTPQSIMPSLNHCDLLRHMGVNNLPKIVTRQSRGRDLNSQPASCKSNALATLDATNKKALHRVVWIVGASSPYENVSVSTLKKCLFLHQCHTCGARPISPCIQLSWVLHICNLANICLRFSLNTGMLHTVLCMWCTQKKLNYYSLHTWVSQFHLDFLLYLFWICALSWDRPSFFISSLIPSKP